MKIVIFCDSVRRIPSFRERLAHTGDQANTLLFVVCNNARRNWLVFFAGLLWHARRYRPREWIDLFCDLARNRLCIGLDPLGSTRTLAFLERGRPDLGLHAMGVIYRSQVIESCGLGILNAHIGQLPKYRGRSVMEWSLLCGDPTGVTVFFIDTGIDTGPEIVLWESVSVGNTPDLDEAKRRLFSRDLELYRMAVEKIQAGEATTPNRVSEGVRFYEMSSLFRTALQSHISGKSAK